MKKKNRIIFSSILGIILLIVIFIPKNKVEVNTLDEVDIEEVEEIEEIVYKYGIPMNQYMVDYGVIKKNQTLSTILLGHGLTMKQIYDLTQKSKGIFDVRKIRQGNGYAFFTALDSLNTPAYFVYEIDPKSYVTFDLNGEFHVERGELPVEWVEKEVSGIVESSLWNAMKSSHADPVVALELARIFGWSIDFFGLQKNDTFSIIYEQETIEGKELPNVFIRAARFVHGNQSYYAIPFEQDAEVLYYNENGNSLEGAFLKAPLDYFRITSRFSNSRFHPVLKRYRAHHGVDYAAPVGTPVYTIGDGTVIARGFQANGGGNYVKIRHNSTYTTTYMHLSRFAKGLKVGDKVKQKQVIGYVGSTGLSTGPHLDFRVYENGKAINPLTIKSQPKKPVTPQNMAAFTALRDSVVYRLDRL